MPPKKRHLTEAEKLELEAERFQKSQESYLDRKRKREVLEKEKEAELAAQSANKKTRPPTTKRRKLTSALPASENVPKPKKSGSRDVDGHLHLYFMAMGQGDCTILITPLGKVFLIDIGNTSAEAKLKDPVNHLYKVLMQNNILGQNRELEAVILTHSDEDHNNHLWLLSHISATVRRIYHSNSFTSYDKRGRGGEDTSLVSDVMVKIRTTQEDYRILGVSYTSSKSSPTACPSFATLYKTKMSKITETYLRQDFRPPVKQWRATRDTGGKVSTLSTTQPAATIPDRSTYPKASTVANPYYRTDNGMVIYQEDTCTVRILVGNYRNYYNAFKLSKPDGDLTPKLMRKKWSTEYTLQTTQNVNEPRTTLPEDINGASIVVLITHQPPGGDEENYVICGDATGDPLFMIESEYPWLKNVTILQAPHHGSDSFGSNSSSFFKQMSPQIAVYSCPFYSVKHHHPRQFSVENMMDAMTSDDSFPSNFGYWSGSDEAGKKTIKNEYYECIGAPYRIYMTGWMQKGYYHYQSPLTTKSNHPSFYKDNPNAKHTVNTWPDDGDDSSDSSDDSSDEQTSTDMSDDSSDED